MHYPRTLVNNGWFPALAFSVQIHTFWSMQYYMFMNNCIMAASCIGIIEQKSLIVPSPISAPVWIRSDI